MWLEQEVTPTLTDDEKVILRNIDENYKYITRSANGNLIIWKSKPQKGSIYWIAKESALDFNAFASLFKFVTFKDVEPYEISKLLGENNDCI